MIQGDEHWADVVILTAIKHEFDAVRKVDAGAVAGSSWEEAPGPSGLPVAYRRFVGKGDRPLRVAVALAPDMGATAVVNTLLPLVEALKPRCVAMCGVCAGRRNKVALGDVIAADRVYYHDTGKQLPGRSEQDLTTYKLRDDWKVVLERVDPAVLFSGEAWFLSRPLTTEWREQRVLVNIGNGDAEPWAGVDPAMSDHEWQEILTGLKERKLVTASGRTLTDAGRSFLDALLFEQRGKLPDVSPAGPRHPLRLHVAPIGSGARVIEDEQIWMFVPQAMRKTLGIEMEAAAIGELVHRQRQHRLDWIVMKGVMDFADHGRDDHFKEYAARVSAECLLWFLREHVTFQELSAATGNHAPTLAVVAQSPGLGTHTFVGRERELAEIEALLTGTTDVQLRAALDGLPGIGKTELARQVVARLTQGKKFSGGIFWFDAEHADLRLQWAKLAEDAGSPALPDLDARAAWAVRQVAQRAQQGEAVLIVLDNVETWDPPPGPLPDMSAIRMLVTARARWLHNSFRPYEVPPLELGPARSLLQAIVGHEVAGADALLAALGGHVLSIEIAATYLREYGTSPAEYLRQLATGKNPGSSVADQTSYRATAESAFRLLWKRIAPNIRQAWGLAAQLPPAWFSSELAEAIGLDPEHRRGLMRLHLLDRDDQGRHQMHRLLREFALAEEPPSQSVQEAVIQGAAEMLETGDEVLTFQRYRRDAASFAHLAVASANMPSSARLRTVYARALYQLGELPKVRQLFEQALASDLKSYGDDHPTVAMCRNNLASVLKDLGELPAAHQLFKRALASDLKTYGDSHPTVAIARNNLASVLQALGDLSAARQLFEQALASDLKTYGADHPIVGTRRNNLAGVLQALGKLPAARQLLEQVLASELKIYRDDHPAVAMSRNNLATVLKDLGELPAARSLFEQALASNVKIYGADHPTVAMSRNNLAGVRQALGDLPAARQLFEQTLASYLKIYGADHPTVALCRNNLAGVLKDLGDLPAARQLFEQALASALKTYGADHPTVATSRSNLAVVLQALGKLPAARHLFEQALAPALKTFGADHFMVATIRNNLALVLQDLGELSTARQLFEQALASDLKTYGADHSTIAVSRNNLALMLKDLGELPAARQLCEQALASDLKTFSEDHPTVVNSRNNLAVVLHELGELPAARNLFEQALASAVKTLGEDHPTVATSRYNLAGVLKALGELPAARRLYEQALASTIKTFGEDHPSVATIRNSLAGML